MHEGIGRTCKSPKDWQRFLEMSLDPDFRKSEADRNYSVMPMFDIATNGVRWEMLLSEFYPESLFAAN